MSEFNKDDYLNDLPDPSDAEAAGQAAQASSGADASAESGSAQDSAAQAPSNEGADAALPQLRERSRMPERRLAKASPIPKTPSPLSARPRRKPPTTSKPLQRERAEFINYRNRAQKEQERFRQHGIIDVLTALLPALDDIDRIRENSEMDDSFKAVAAKIDKAFEKFGVEKFGEKGEDFDPTKHEAILHKPDADADKETVDTVVGSRLPYRRPRNPRRPSSSSLPAKLITASSLTS